MIQALALCVLNLCQDKYLAYFNPKFQKKSLTSMLCNFFARTLQFFWKILKNVLLWKHKKLTSKVEYLCYFGFFPADPSARNSHKLKIRFMNLAVDLALYYLSWAVTELNEKVLRNSQYILANTYLFLDLKRIDEKLKYVMLNKSYPPDVFTNSQSQKCIFEADLVWSGLSIDSIEMRNRLVVWIGQPLIA